MKKWINDLYSLDNEKLNEKERRRIRLALAFIMSAQNRRESRGAHKRSDHPHPDESMRKTTVVFYKDEMIKTEFCRIGGELL